MTQATILFVDNDRDFLYTRTEFLERAGYRVIPVSSPMEAKKALERGGIDLAILDIRMRDDDDERDTSGLTLAQDKAYKPLPKIVLTGFPTYQAVREVLGPAVDGLPAAVDFFSKREGPQAMIQAVDQAFAEHVHINQALLIEWDQRQRLSFLHLTHLLQPDLPDDLVVQQAGELEGLFRRLFYDYQQIRIGQLLWHDHWRCCLSILAQSPQGATDPRILVCGQRVYLEQEIAQLGELAPQTTQCAKLINTAETLHFGGVIYVLPDAPIETIQPLRGLFQLGRERPLKTTIDNLLKKVLTTWHQRGQKLESMQGLMALYRQQVGLGGTDLPRTEVESRVTALLQATRPLDAMDVTLGDGVVTFYFLNQPPLVYPDPVATVYKPLAGYDRSVICKISPGQLTADNVLADANQQPWLTDFARAGQAPQWWDFVCLEATIRFDLNEAPDLLAWQEFEEILIAPAQLYDRLPVQDVIANLRLAVTLIEQIRRQAGSETGPDIKPYYAGLLVWLVGAIARRPPTFYTQAERMRGAHLLLAAAMLAHRLKEAFSSSHPAGALRLDDDGVVWIGEQRVSSLGKLELQLFRCLYERQDRPVSRQIIVESVFEETYLAGDKYQETRINSLVRRLRVKIEPNPKRSRYILTDKGKGYRLNVTGE